MKMNSLSLSRSGIHKFCDQYFEYIAFLIIFAALSVRVVYIYIKDEYLLTDSFSYIEMAFGILKNEPISYFPNGYPLIISLIVTLFGESNFVGILLLLNVIFVLITLILLFVLGRKFSKQASLISLCIVGFLPNQIHYTSLVMTESLSTMLLLLVIFLLCSKNVFHYFLCGICFGLLITVKSSMFVLFPAIVLYIFSERCKLKSLFLGAFRFTLGLFLVMSAIYVLEWLEYIRGSSNLAVNLFLATQAFDFSGVDFTKVSLMNSLYENEPFKMYGLAFVEDPIKFLNQRLAGLFLLWGPAVDDGGYGRSYLYQLLLSVRLPLFLLFIFEIIQTFKLKDTDNYRYVILFSIPVVCLTILYMMFFSTARFTVVMEPLVVLVVSKLLAKYISPQKIKSKI